MNIKVNEKKLLFLSLVIIFGLVITACSDNKVNLKGQEVTKINILKPEDKPYGFEENTYRRHDDEWISNLKANEIGSVTDENSLNIFIKAIKTAEINPPVLFIPEYYIQIVLKNDEIETYYLSLDGGVMEDAKDANHRVYKLESAKRTINSRKLC
jgi:hypothetical protein